MTLYVFQEKLLQDVRDAYASGARSVVMQLGTGGGKTHTAAHALASCVRKGGRAVFLAHLDALLDDTARRLEEEGVHVGVVQADRARSPNAPVQVCSLQTLAARPLERPPADLVILDEAHRCMGPTVRQILDAYPKARLLGLTATPQRGDGQPLGDVFERMVCGPSVKDLIALHTLVPCHVLAPVLPRDGLAMDVVDAYEKHAPLSLALVFAESVIHAQAVADDFNRRGHPAACVTGDTPREVRRDVRAKMARRDLRVLVGVGIFTEGWNQPELDTIILARQFTVTGTFLQAIGRGLRSCPVRCKRLCTVIDLRGSVLVHGLPDEDRRWNLEGSACVRTEKMAALRRCPTCFAVFRPTKTCPRCGMALGAGVAQRLPRRLRRDEKLEAISDKPQWEKDRKYLQSLSWIARSRVRLFGPQADEWAAAKFRERFGREPEAPPENA